MLPYRYSPGSQTIARRSEREYVLFLHRPHSTDVDTRLEIPRSTPSDSSKTFPTGTDLTHCHFPGFTSVIRQNLLALV